MYMQGSSVRHVLLPCLLACVAMPLDDWLDVALSMMMRPCTSCAFPLHAAGLPSWLLVVACPGLC